jgi:predicted nucleic acid-binding protein
MRQLFVDTSTLAYAFGAEHPLRQACRDLLGQAEAGEIRIHVSTEGVQEFLHHRLRRAERSTAVTQARTLVDLCVLHPIDGAVVEKMLTLVESSSVGGRDAVHAATALLSGFDSIVSADPDFDGIPGLTRIAPSALGHG